MSRWLRLIISGCVISGCAFVVRIFTGRLDDAKKAAKEDEDAAFAFVEGRLPGAGKDTLLHIIKGEGFKDEYKATIAKDTIQCEINDKKWYITNMPGSSSFYAEAEEIRKELQGKNKPVVDIYIFDMRQYAKELHNIQAAFNEASDRGFKFIAIGTHLDLMQSSHQKQEIEDMKTALKGIKFYPYSLKTNPQKEILQILQSQVS